ncbi:hypothetical protein FC39_GL000613 [Lactobacillus hamsteri DSM 5661 = JCM 6256]|uniref:Uncharacterized protein n=1 Tax=Lactobacillus hamsteri DSM 5661 = JCM 6256 TaxID=1423754 RepID=A0A0R1YDA4_9LACO|nr:hypothetical protein FC39_GL000613 [Lactobacillus hamsteri DSM 5661 = JCM 6256]
MLTERKADIDPHIDFLVITRPSARNFDMTKVRRNLVHALALAHVIEMPNENEEN